MADDAAKKGDAPPAAGGDVVVLGPPTPDGEGIRVLRAREERIETGELRALREGKPITGEVVSLEPRKDNPQICDVRSSYTAPSSAARKGPAQVATKSYRDNWDEIFTPSEKRTVPGDRSLN
jgi:hypothetical protein